MEGKLMDITLERIISLIPQTKNGRFERGEAAKFAEKIGVAANLPAEWKAGRNKSYKTKLHEISNAYNVSLEWLNGETDIKEKPAPKNGDGLSDDERIMLEKFRSISLDDRKTILRIMNGLTEK